MKELVSSEVDVVSGADQAPTTGTITAGGQTVVVAECPSGTEMEATRSAEGGVTLTCVSK